MIEKILDLDYKGIIPLEKENGKEFYDRGKRFLDTALKLKDKFQREDSLVDITSELSKLEEEYKTKPDWISCKRGVPQIDPLIKIGARTIATKYNGLVIPIAYIMKDNMSRSKKHEMIHCIRWPIEKYHNISQYFVPWRKYTRSPEEIATQFLNLRGDYTNHSDKRIQNPDLLSAIFFGAVAPSVCALTTVFIPQTTPSLIQLIFIAGYSGLLGIKNLNSLIRAKQTSKAFKEIEMNTKDSDFKSKLSYSLLRLKPDEIRSLTKNFKKFGYNEKSLKNYLEKERNENLRFGVILEKIAA